MSNHLSKVFANDLLNLEVCSPLDVNKPRLWHEIQKLYVFGHCMKTNGWYCFLIDKNRLSLTRTFRFCSGVLKILQNWVLTFIIELCSESYHRTLFLFRIRSPERYLGRSWWCPRPHAESLWQCAAGGTRRCFAHQHWLNQANDARTRAPLASVQARASTHKRNCSLLPGSRMWARDRCVLTLVSRRWNTHGQYPNRH